MIETFYSSGTLQSPQAFLVAFLIGIVFGVILEQVGFGSSRRLSGVFYLRDMAVFKVMFTALVGTAIGYGVLEGVGLVSDHNTHLVSTVVGANIVGGLIFGVGFAMAGWCPGTAAVGLASGKYDAGVFLGGIVIGCILYNETFPIVEPLHNWGGAGAHFFFDTLPIGRAGMTLVMLLAAAGCFYVSERVENPASKKFTMKDNKVVIAVLLVFGAVTFGLLIVPGQGSAGAYRGRGLLEAVEEGLDHVDPPELARRMVAGERDLMLVDVRPEDEYNRFHLKTARNIHLSDLPGALAPYKNVGTIVLYSNGMTHPAQARDALTRMGYKNVFILTEGLTGFVDQCLTPVSLRDEPVPEALAQEIRLWRAFFLTATTRTARL
ncbi:MAG: rhodanese-like domain-containing protein [Myxococcota bacterium]|nr:rhodanese-like domain-containing protein [Myxococcota bacterium]